MRKTQVFVSFCIHFAYHAPFAVSAYLVYLGFLVFSEVGRGYNGSLRGAPGRGIPLFHSSYRPSRALPLPFQPPPPLGILCGGERDTLLTSHQLSTT